ncbi:MAG: DUF159 family protein [Candidatus Leucobacter sulfamidivorax]|nr:DUF159 family protein [Candidatus Leucobacter sulfamidivorax]
MRFEAIPPLEEPGTRRRIEAWAAADRGRARITGRIARNLNPLIHAPRGERELAFGWWWLHVNGRPAEYSAFNSRDDRLLRSWHEPFQRRALLPASWYVEKGRVFGLPGGEPFAIAAITTSTPQDGGGTLLSYSMVTRDAVGEAATAHPRMPLVLPAAIHDEWLDRARPGDAGLVARAVAASQALSAEMRIRIRDPRAGGTGSGTGATASQPALFDL